MKEEWKDILGYDGYQVSNLGNVRTFNKVSHTDRHGERHWKNRILKQKVAKDKSHRVDLWNSRGHKTFLVHRLVASAFLSPPPSENYTVNHIDGNRSNNILSNLEWLTLADNIKYGFEHNQYPQKRCYLIHDKDNKFCFRSLAEASRFLGRNNNYVSGRLKRKSNAFDRDGHEYWIIVSPGYLRM